VADAVLQSDLLRLTVADNAAAPGRYAGFHGAASLVHVPTGRELFAPGYSGLSLESVQFSGFAPADEVVGPREPRHSPMTLDAGEPGAVRLHQPATRHFGVETEITYRLAGEDCVEVAATYRFHRAETVGRTFVALWTNRMHAPSDRRLYLPGHTEADPAPRRLRLSAASADAPRRVADADDPGPETAERFTWGAPFWFGRVDGLAFAASFENPAVTGLAYSPTGGLAVAAGSCGWNWFHRVASVRTDRTYGVRQWFTVRPFAGWADVIAEFTRRTGRSLEVRLR
jgi:hypothetical protein